MLIETRNNRKMVPSQISSVGFLQVHDNLQIEQPRHWNQLHQGNPTRVESLRNRSGKISIENFNTGIKGRSESSYYYFEMSVILILGIIYFKIEKT